MSERREYTASKEAGDARITAAQLSKVWRKRWKEGGRGARRHRIAESQIFGMIEKRSETPRETGGGRNKEGV